jgi:hypothetical protein
MRRMAKMIRGSKDMGFGPSTDNRAITAERLSIPRAT